MFAVKPWQVRGRRMERNAPIGRKCDELCTHPHPALNSNTALCSVCHETFSTVANFDRHRKDGWCQEPSSVGLRVNKNGHWGQPMPPGDLERLRALGGGWNEG